MEPLGDAMLRDLKNQSFKERVPKRELGNEHKFLFHQK